MKIYSKTFKLCCSSAIIIALSNFAHADEAKTSEFENKYQPNQREVCEMALSSQSWNTVFANRPECKSTELFEPLKTLKKSGKIRKLNLTKTDASNWPVKRTSLEFKSAEGDYSQLFLEIDDGGNFDIAEFYQTKFTIETASIGHLGDAIILELAESLGGTHTQRRQIIFTPYSCQGYDGYGGEIYYMFSQMFVWSPAFANEIYQKTFFSPPICN